MSKYEMGVPEGWRRLDHLCYPENGSKAYKSETTSANAHVVNLYDTGAYVVNCEDQDGEWFSDRLYDYFDALATARGWMLTHE